MQEEDGSTALHCAVKAGCLEIVESLINAGADVNVSNKSGDTPLHIAIKENSLQNIISILDQDVIEQGKVYWVFQDNILHKVGIKDGIMTDTISNSKSTLKVAQFLREVEKEYIQNNDNPLYWIYKDNQLQMFSGSKPGDNDKLLNSCDVSEYATKLVQKLINAGSNVNVKDRFDQTALDYAEQVNNEQIVDLLKAAAMQQGQENAGSDIASDSSSLSPQEDFVGPESEKSEVDVAGDSYEVWTPGCSQW